MTSHVYLVASLPTLMPDLAPGLSVDEFLALCQRHISPREVEQLAGARIEDHETYPTTPVYAGWRAFDADLREQLLILRANLLGWDAAESTRRDQPVLVTDPVRAAFQASDPRIAERALFQLRWKYLDDLDRAYFMRLENLVVYALKLQLIEQRMAATREHGAQVLDGIRRGFAAHLPSWDL